MQESSLQTERAPRIRLREASVNVIAISFDVIAILAAHAVCYRLFWDLWFGHDTAAAAIAIVIYYIVASARGLHRELRSESLARAFQRLLACWACVVPLLLAAGFFTKTLEVYSRLVQLSWFVAAPLLITAGRLLVRALNRARLFGSQARRVAVYGASALGAELVSNFEGAPWFDAALTRVYDDRQHVRPRSDDRVMELATSGDLDALIAAARAGTIDVVYIALPLRAERRISEVIRRLGDTTASVSIACGFGHITGAVSEWRQVGPVAVMELARTELRAGYHFAKRLEDLVLGALLMLLFALPMLAIALAVKLSSRGPVLTRKLRCRLNGQEIRLLKFRITELDAPGGGGALTRVGAWLQRTGLDEVPELIEVLLGNLSIVGPRPHPLALNNEYRALVVERGFRGTIKPGITCSAQVNNWRQFGASERVRMRVEYDLAYAEDWALKKDLDIILRTAHTFVRPWRGRHSSGPRALRSDELESDAALRPDHPGNV